MSTDCPLCEMHTREPHRTLFHNGRVMVVVNIEPVKPGHVMVLPLRHVRQLSDLNAEEALAMMRAVDRCMHGLAARFPDPPLCVVNGWKHRTQEHLHVHVLPSKKGLRGLFSASEGTLDRVRIDEETLARTADELRSMFV